MRTWSIVRRMPLVVLPILLLGACATHTPPSSDVLAKVLNPVPNYALAPCEMQRKWAAHNSTVDSIKSGAIVVYKAPCDADGKPVASVPGRPKTSGIEVDIERARRVAGL
jgi:hypothetical protein